MEVYEENLISISDYRNRMSLKEKIAALPKKEPIYVENMDGKQGYLGVGTKGENKIEFQKIARPLSKGSFVRLAVEPDRNCFFSSLLMSTRTLMLQLTHEGKIEFTRLFRESLMTPDFLAKLKEAGANDDLEKIEDTAIAMLIAQELGYTAIFLNPTNGDPKIPRISRSQCSYTIQDDNRVILFMFYGNHYEPVFFKRNDNTFISIFNLKKDSEELKPILELVNACARVEGAEAGAGAPAEAQTPAEAQVPAQVEQIVAAFVEEHAATWKASRPTFLHKTEKHTTSSRPLEESLKNPFIPMDNFLVKTCRGTNNDCIVNSLLTCLSPTFRRLEGEYKDKVASFYRYEKLLPMYRRFIKDTTFSDEKSKANAESILREIAAGIDNYKIDIKKLVTRGYGGVPISAEVAAAFGITHGINVLIKESEAREKGAFTLLGPQPAAPTFIIIHNIDGVHYSSISDSTDNYVFPTTMLQTWITESEQAQLTANKSKCRFITDQVLRRDGKLYIVVNAENTDDGQACKNLYIHELDGDVNAYKQDIRNILSIQKALSPPTVRASDTPNYKEAIQVEWEGVKAGAKKALESLKKRYPIFKKQYKTYKEVYADAVTLPFVDIKDNTAYELANPDVKDKYGVPSTYLEFMAALQQRGGAKRRTRRKNLSGVSQ